MGRKKIITHKINKRRIFLPRHIQRVPFHIHDLPQGPNIHAKGINSLRRRRDNLVHGGHKNKYREEEFPLLRPILEKIRLPQHSYTKNRGRSCCRKKEGAGWYEGR